MSVKKDCINCKYIRNCMESHQYACSLFTYVGKTPINQIKKPKKSKDLCFGCRNNFYNQDGKNISIGKNGCFSYKSATIKLVNNIHSLNQRPPYSLIYRLSCYRKKY